MFALDVIRCDNVDCSVIHSLPGSPVVFVASPWAIGQTVPSALVWDKPHQQIVGLVNLGLPSQEAQVVSYGALSDVDPPAGDLKEIMVTTVEANCTAARTMSQITAVFDNFYAR